MKLRSIVPYGVRLFPCESFMTPRDLNFPCPEGEILEEKSAGVYLSCFMRFRLGVDQPWQWRGFETDGHRVNYYFLDSFPLDSSLRGALSSMRHAPGYQYLVEGFAPLSPESPDWLFPLADDEKEDVIKWRMKLLREYDHGRAQ